MIVRGSERQADRIGETFAHGHKLAVFRSKVMAPFRDAMGFVDVLLVFLQPKRTVEEQGRHTKRSQLLYLVFHQRDERRKINSKSIENQRRNLVAQRFAATGGHDGQRITPRQNVFDHFALIWAESIIAEGFFEDRGGSGHR